MEKNNIEKFGYATKREVEQFISVLLNGNRVYAWSLHVTVTLII
jgi:hypothetical protein